MLWNNPYWQRRIILTIIWIAFLKRLCNLRLREVNDHSLTHDYMTFINTGRSRYLAVTFPQQLEKDNHMAVVWLSFVRSMSRRSFTFDNVALFAISCYIVPWYIEGLWLTRFHRYSYLLINVLFIAVDNVVSFVRAQHIRANSCPQFAARNIFIDFFYRERIGLHNRYFVDDIF